MNIYVTTQNLVEVPTTMHELYALNLEFSSLSYGLIPSPASPCSDFTLPTRPGLTHSLISQMVPPPISQPHLSFPTLLFLYPQHSAFSNRLIHLLTYCIKCLLPIFSPWSSQPLQCKFLEGRFFFLPRFSVHWCNTIFVELMWHYLPVSSHELMIIITDESIFIVLVRLNFLPNCPSSAASLGTIP